MCSWSEATQVIGLKQNIRYKSCTELVTLNIVLNSFGKTHIQRNSTYFLYK